MHTSTNRDNFGALIAIVETLFLFFIGLLSSKISEALRIEPITLLLFTMVSLIVLAVISYVKFHPISTSQTQPTASGVTFARFIPKTMIGIFPFGVAVGLVIGIVIPSVGLATSSIESPTWIANLYGCRSVDMHSYELIGIFIAIVFCILFAILIDGRLAAAILIGYGISFPTALIVIRPEENSAFLTYTAYIIGFGIIGVILLVIEPILKWLRGIVTEPRI